MGKLCKCFKRERANLVKCRKANNLADSEDAREG